MFPHSGPPPKPSCISTILYSLSSGSGSACGGRCAPPWFKLAEQSHLVGPREGSMLVTKIRHRHGWRGYGRKAELLAVEPALQPVPHLQEKLLLHSETSNLLGSERPKRHELCSKLVNMVQMKQRELQCGSSTPTVKNPLSVLRHMRSRR